MQPALGRRLARRVMVLALLISPPESRDWTAAMAAELEYVEGSFKTLFWALDCFGTTLKFCCISLFSPVPGAQGTMGKFAKISAIALAAGSTLFLLAPTFQQGLKLTTASWHPSDSAWLAEMRNLGAKAEARHDAQMLAFVAMQLNDESESLQRDKFADEAVQWNPQLTWIYYPLLSHDQRQKRRDANDTRWFARLQAWDPNNAAVYAREASFYWPRGVSGLNPQSERALLASSPQWLDDMEKAFSATDYSSYVARSAALDRQVVQHYGLNDPSRMFSFIAFYPVIDLKFDFYAKDFLLKAGTDFEAKGNLAGAEESYWKVERLGEVIQLRGDSDLERSLGNQLQLSADSHLETVFEKSGNTEAANLVAYQTELAQQTERNLLSQHRRAIMEGDSFQSQAWAVQLSLLGMAVSLALILCCGMYFGARRMLRFASTANSSLFFARTGLAGTVLLFTSAMVMYFSYAPYATLFQAYLAGSSPRDAFLMLRRFWFLEYLPSAVFYWFQSASFKVGLWYTVIVLGGASIAWIIYRYIARMFYRSAPIHPAT